MGVEEEVFVLEQGRMVPTLQSLDYMRRLLWANPRRYRKHCATNFARGRDQKVCFMGSIEISTGVHENVDSLIEDLIQRRTDFALATRGAMVVPVGSLFTIDSPSNTSGLHIHFGVPAKERARVYDNLAYFMPVLAVASASSPFRKGTPFGLSYRIARPHALGELREDREYRFQDIIVTKRLGTIEIRVLDPVPDIERLRHILQAALAVAHFAGRQPFDRSEHNRMRADWAERGLTPWLETRLRELQQVYPFPRGLLERTFAHELREIAEKDSFRAAYRRADAVWREPTGVPLAERPHSRMRVLAGFGGFYAVRLPYMAVKGWREWRGRPPA